MKIGDVVEVSLIGTIQAMEVNSEGDIIYKVILPNNSNRNEIAYVKESRLTPAENR